MPLTGTRLIIQRYLDHGGAAMDEEHYQQYRHEVLANWLERYFQFLDYGEKSRYGRCRECGWNYDLNVSGDDALIAHLKTHFPEMFHE